MNALNHINTNLIVETEISVDELVKEYNSKLNDLGILLKESSTYKSEATFDSKIWIFYTSDTSSYNHVNFSKIVDMVKLNLIEMDDYKILKCWIVDKIIEGNLEGSTIKGYTSSLIKIFIETNGFKKEFIKSKNGNAIKTFIDYSETDSVARSRVKSLESYIDFIDRIGYTKDSSEILSNTILEYRIAHKKSNPRKLPKNSSIFEFDYCIKSFFEGDNDPLLQKIYYPIWIWWKVTNVIPMRPSELISKTTRDCLIEEDGVYYLKVNRVKVKRTNYTINKPMIPILNKLQISKEIYDLIKDYIEFTNFEESFTLFSWSALNEFKKQYMETKTLDDYRGYLPTFLYDNTSRKYNSLEFNSSAFRVLLDKFYDDVVDKLYGFEVEDKEKLKPGDTRHLAFSSLYLQGLSPIEIAMLGGHTTLEMQDSYTNHVQYYIDSEVLNFISDKSVCGENSKMFKTLKDIIFSKKWSYELNLDLSQFDKTEDGVGYCLLDPNSDDFCDNVPNCVFCRKWWCEPTNESYKLIKEYVLSKEISPLSSEIETEEMFFINLINEAKIVNINGLAEIDKQDNENLRTQSLKVKAKADKLAFLKASLLERKFEKENRFIDKENSNE